MFNFCETKHSLLSLQIQPSHSISSHCFISNFSLFLWRHSNNLEDLLLKAQFHTDNVGNLLKLEDSICSCQKQCKTSHAVGRGEVFWRMFISSSFSSVAALWTVLQLLFLCTHYSLVNPGLCLPACLELLSVNVGGHCLVWGKVLPSWQHRGSMPPPFCSSF